jgi:carboxypeptidase Taq
LGSHFPQAAQKALGQTIMAKLGFDFEHGRLDTSSHPFCGGVPSDVRITTRYDEKDFTSALMGVIHETGHARYEQNLPKAWSGLPVGAARSMGIHESQSLFFEMQIGRNPNFLEYILGDLQQHLGLENSPESLNNLKHVYARVEKGYIRVDADELTYPIHVILRYQIERDLIEGKIEVADIPGRWNLAMMENLDLSTEGRYDIGCMQDIHWTDGAFGYFPSYTLGALYAAQYQKVIAERLGDFDGLIRSGRFEDIFDQLNTMVWSKASLLDTEDLISHGSGEALNPQYFREHLERRYL